MPNFLDKTTQWWVKLTGRKIDPKEYSWLLGPIGKEDIIKDTFFQTLANEDNLGIHYNLPNAGLLKSIQDIGITEEEKSRLSPEIIDFYEHTGNYTFEVWSEWKGLFKSFGHLLSILFSKRLQQLNLPLNPIDASKGFKSDIIQLVNKITGEIKWTIWLRILKISDDVVYSGVYTHCRTSPFFCILGIYKFCVFMIYFN